MDYELYTVFYMDIEIDSTNYRAYGCASDISNDWAMTPMYSDAIEPNRFYVCINFYLKMLYYINIYKSTFINLVCEISMW